ncbi:DsbA family protein [Cereibacter sphaeroides]|uniref:DsbA family protein n=1 Tax=Cereibacter sphaeroides TaxID=1063 RepID=UPI001F2D60A9|nr:DsbA family protein [Cereibacter sphaeroides]MCE6958754.1 DsbA family protein [Cereibacter sphaeroides]MCE6973372.1 DsbA family protein [Cereibacter sphaeroides]
MLTIPKRVLLQAVLAAGAGLFLSGTAPAIAASPAGTAPEAALPAIAEMAIGNPDAKVTIVEYSSFTCPHCAVFEKEVFAPLKRDFIDSGKVRFVFREAYTHRYGLWASMVARCDGGSGRFFGIAHMMFDKQDEWLRKDDAGAVMADLRKFGLVAGLEAGAIDACMKDEAKAKALVGWYQANMAADGVEATPTLIVNGKAHSNLGYDKLKELLEAELAR